MRTLSAVLAIALFAPPAFADAEYSYVTSVAPDDVLNVRQAPGADQPIVGALSPFASAVEVLERREGWARVRRGDVDGWVAARYLTSEGPAAMAGDAPPDPLICTGTEPFWSVRFENELATYSTPEGEEPATEITARRPSRNSTIVWSLAFGENGSNRAVIQRDPLCSDGMSDNTYPLSIALTRPDGQFLSGCCRLP